MATKDDTVGKLAPAPAIRSVRRASGVAGIGLAMMALLSAFAVFGTLGGIGSAGDTERVAQAITESGSLFRWGILALILVAISQLPGLFADAGRSELVAQRVQTFDDLWHVGLVFFGVHLVLIGWRAYRSGWVAKVFGVLLVVAGLGYLADSVGTVVVPGYSPVIAQFTFVGEVALIFWLLVRGSRLATLESTTAGQTQGAGT